MKRAWGAILLAAAACNSHRTDRAIPSDLAAWAPSDTAVLAGVHLEKIRGAALYNSLPVAWRAMLEPLHQARELLLAFNGTDLLVIASGMFSTAPPGAELIGSTLALAGSPAAVRAAKAQHATGRTGAPVLLDRAAPSADKLIWMVAEGRRPLPLAGNLANLNRFLKMVDYATLTVDGESRVDVRAAGFCGSAAEATHLEEALRALITLAGIGSRDPELSAVLKSAQVTRNDSKVQLAISADGPALEKLLR